MIHEILPSKKKWKNNVMPCPSIKSPSLWYGSVFFLKKDNIMLSLLENEKKHIFWMEFHLKILNF